MRIVALDPGTEKTAFVVLDGSVIESGILPNSEMLQRICDNNFGSADVLTIEMIASMGMAVGKETFETCVWIGRFWEASRLRVWRIFRQEIKLHLCGQARAKDANVRQALLDRFGGSKATGTKKSPGPLYGISSHKWAALAVAVYAQDHYPNF